MPEVTALAVSVYFLSGRYDLTVNRDLSEEYLEKPVCPVKGFCTFGNPAHSPMFEEPGRFPEIMTKYVLNGTTTLADR